MDIVQVAALAHDIGHPPFGHNGEHILDELMRNVDGGFEGNAQTFRIVAILEKKGTLSYNNGEAIPIVDGEENRCGLNLTARALASVLKYDYKIPQRNRDRIEKYQNGVAKGYYESEADIVKKIKECVLGTKKLPPDLDFKTLECSIMDISDDIAYSTYDIEDAFKANFNDPLQMIAANEDVYAEIAIEVKEKIDKEYKDYSDADRAFSALDARVNVMQLFSNIAAPGKHSALKGAAQVFSASQGVASNGYLRTDFTSNLVKLFVDGVKFEYNKDFPPLSKAYLALDTFKMVETIKKFTYKSMVMSPRLKIAEYRGKEIVRKLFEVLTDDDNGYLLLPEDYRALYADFDGSEQQQRRVICDFVAGMTDRYALEFYNRVFGISPESIYKPS